MPPVVISSGERAPTHTASKTSHWRPMYEMVISGVGIGVLEGPACVDALADGRLVRILPQFDVLPFDLNVLIQAQRSVPPRVRRAVSILRKCTPEILERMHEHHGNVEVGLTYYSTTTLPHFRRHRCWPESATMAATRLRLCLPDR